MNYKEEKEFLSILQFFLISPNNKVSIENQLLLIRAKGYEKLKWTKPNHGNLLVYDFVLLLEEIYLDIM
ncbi:unnamed protein product [Trifolium pratense]|uniref:Uncharacterized protein n=1 Tax=Trifolium pratense TaxID=57577 RepID=A0ACB0KHE9_TRIPR|nr:unnamed protein product [Trifolium pratense]